MCLQQKLRKDPYVTTLGGFSKVTNYIFDAFRGTEEQHQRPPEEVADLLGEVIPGLEINQQEEPGFEVITRVRGRLHYYLIIFIMFPQNHHHHGDTLSIRCSLFIRNNISVNSVCLCVPQMDLGTRPEVTRTQPLSSEDWVRHQDSEGRMVNVQLLKQNIFKGVSPLIVIFSVCPSCLCVSVSLCRVSVS